MRRVHIANSRNASGQIGSGTSGGPVSSSYRGFGEHIAGRIALPFPDEMDMDVDETQDDKVAV